MAKQISHAVVFKAYEQHRTLLLPPSLEELIAADHPVRVVSAVLDKINLDSLLKTYKGGGTSAYHPRLLLKVLVYGYINNTYSSRKLEAALKENIHYMWLAGMTTPDHNTLNRFRSQRLVSAELQSIFSEVVLLLCEEGLLSLKELYTDGTKVEASANRYTFVWGKAIETNRQRIKAQLQELWQYAQNIAKEELDDDNDPGGFSKIAPQKVAQTIENINEALQDKAVSKKVKQKLLYAEKHFAKNLQKYEQQQQILGTERNSYSKTDTDATFMRLKEDHLKNGQLKPAYNVQLSTNNQFVTTYTLHQTTTDTTTLTAHLQQHEKCYGRLPEAVITDAGYGSEQNYQYLEEKGIDAYVKHAHFDRRQRTATGQKHPFSPEKLFYNPEQDAYYCPMGQKMACVAVKEKKTTTGFVQTVHLYQARRCEGCPLRGVCHKGKGNRVIEVNHNLNRLRQKADELLRSEEGIKRRKQRPCDVEPVFGNIKQNHHFRRFLLRGMEKVKVETGLLALAHNLRKKATLNQAQTNENKGRKGPKKQKSASLSCFFSPAAVWPVTTPQKTKNQGLSVLTKYHPTSLLAAA
jgi:transposase